MLKILCILLFPNYVHLFSEIMEIHVLWLHSSIFFYFFFHTKLYSLQNWKILYFHHGNFNIFYRDGERKSMSTER
jgi:hypothetical protein